MMSDADYVVTGELMIASGAVTAVALIACAVLALKDSLAWKPALGVAVVGFVIFTAVCWTVAQQA